MLTQRELDVLNVLYSHSEPMTITDITEARKGLTQSTVISVIRKMLRDGLVKVTGVTHSGRVLSRTYRPTEKARETILEHFIELYSRIRWVVPAEELCKKIMEV